jgi:hypothetical protein
MFKKRFKHFICSPGKEAEEITPEHIRKMIRKSISEQRQHELRPENYDVKSTLFALSELDSLIQSTPLPTNTSAGENLQDYINLIYDFQQQYRQNPLDSDQYGGGAAVIGSVVSRVITHARQSGIKSRILS